ncbi:MAG: M1 family aminopeptidase [Aliidongia sp.]
MMIRFSPLARRWAGGFVVVFSALAIGTALAEAPFDFAMTPGNLPKSVVPLAYRLDLAPDLDTLGFTGQEEIDIDVTAPTDTITLNANALSFSRVSLVGEDGTAVTVSLDPKLQTASFHLAPQISPGRHTLAISYAGTITPQPRGFYYNDFPSPQGRQRMLVTQFEDTDARDMLPCWDEPAFKATYRLSVVLPKSYAAISNTPIESEGPAGTDAKGGSLKKVGFGQTPKMSSYLLVLAAGPLDRIQTKAGGADIGVWAVPGKQELGRYAMNAAAKILPFYNDYFGVKYPLPKMDLIAVPGNFAAGAMENWGGLTFIDNALLFDPATSSPQTREAIFNVVAHEMAHQWSGDLVTMAWWDNTWLNEGFATWMAAKASDRFNATWDIWPDSRMAKERAMAIDARSTTHPIQIKIADESEISAAFDSISYLKGAALIRMLETYLSEPIFREGMRGYMKAHAYSNSTSADLWAALAAASGKPVAEIAAGFTEQPGIPLIKVESECIKTDRVVTLTEDRFTIHDPNAAKLTWQVPVQIGTVGGHAPRTVLVGDRPETVSFPGCDKPVQANYGDVGYFRVQYDPASLKALIAGYKTLPLANRAALLADQWALVKAGRAEVASYLDLTKALTGENDRVVWTMVVDALNQIDTIERGSPDRAAFRRYAIGLLHPVLDRLGWTDRPNDSAEAVLLRGEVIGALGEFGDEAVIAESRKRFDGFLTEPASLSPTIAGPVITTVGRYADQATWDKLHALGKAASGTEEKLRYYFALAGAHDPALIDQSVAIALTDEISNGRVNRFVIHAAEASDDPDRVWADVVANPEPILAKLSEFSRGPFLTNVAASSSSPETEAALRSLPAATANSGARYEVGRAAETIESRIDLRNRLLGPVGRWLHANGGA